MYRITYKRELNDQVTLMKIEAPLVAQKARAGQFIIFRVDEYGERVPPDHRRHRPGGGHRHHHLPEGRPLHRAARQP